MHPFRQSEEPKEPEVKVRFAIPLTSPSELNIDFKHVLSIRHIPFSGTYPRRNRSQGGRRGPG
jgi:hypothetical protein